MTTEYISVTDTAKIIRKELKANYPGIKFSVRSEKYAGGASINIDWTDGPTASEVDGIVQGFRGADFDGSTDSMHYRNDLVPDPVDGFKVVHYGAHFIFTNRKTSADLAQRLVPLAAPIHGHFNYPYCGTCSAPVGEDAYFIPGDLRTIGCNAEHAAKAAAYRFNADLQEVAR